MKHEILKDRGYILGEKIGEGSFGKVYKGFYKDEEVAIKIMQGTKFQETSILESLRHNNVIKFHKSLKQGNYQYLIMEYASGGSLSDYLKKDLKEETIIQTMKSIFKGVEYLHSKQIIHRDIKPDNILIANQDNLTSIKIADFGLSYQYNPEFRLYQKVSQQCGTFIFMAPEQILNQSYNKAVDIWSCGIVLYMLLNKGEHPFYPQYKTKEQFIENFPFINYEEPKEASPLAKDLLRRLLKNDQDSRYTASQALVHPWITQRYNDPIPMSVKEFGKCQENKIKISGFIKSLLFLTHLKKESIKISPFHSKNELGDFRISITEFDEDTPDEEDGQITPNMLQYTNRLSIQRPIKLAKSFRNINNISQKGKSYQLNSLLNSNNESQKSKNPRKIQLHQQNSLETEILHTLIDPDSPKKQTHRIILPALSESTQVSLSPLKLKQKPLVKQNSFRKSESSFFFGGRVNNESEIGIIRNRIETVEKYQVSQLNSQRIKNNSYQLVSPKHLKTQTNFLIPKKIN